MRTVTFLGIESEPQIEAVRVGDITLERGKPVFVLARQLPGSLGRFGTEGIDVHETTVCEMKGCDVEYTDEFAEMNVTAIIPNYKAPDLIEDAVTSLKRHYPDLLLIVVDDGSDTETAEYVRQLQYRFSRTISLLLPDNIGHGAALHRAISQVFTKRVFTMDSDVIVDRGGFLELMESRMVERGLYGTGMMYWRDHKRESPYLTCVAAMYDLAMYRSLPPFVHEGDPMARNMDAAHKAGYKVEPFPMMRYITHLECGTRRRFGYRWDMTGG